MQVEVVVMIKVVLVPVLVEQVAVVLEQMVLD